MALSLLAPWVIILSQASATFSTQELASLIRVLSAQAGTPGRIACRDLDLSIQLKKDGLSTDPRSPVAWASDANQARNYRAEGKFVLCADPALLKEGAALALVREGGRTGLILHTVNAQASGLTLSDAILKVAKRI